MATIYLIDFENVNTAETLNFSLTCEDDEIHVFYTEHCSKISLDILNGMKARLYVHRIPCGSQEVDMHISGKLGYLICRYGNTKQYAIISKDKGYTNTARTWETEEDVTVTLSPCIGESAKQEPVPAIPQKTQSSVRTELNNRILSEFSTRYDSVTAGKVASLVLRNQGKKNARQTVYRALLKEMKKETGCQIYNTLKEQKLI
ncbi:MAG: PIN domain-containing protein [Bulleidia sp.]